MDLQTRLFDVGVALAIAAIFHGLITRRLRAEVASLRKDMSALPGHILGALLERGAIQQDREPLARRTVEDFFGIEQLLRRTYPRASIDKILGQGDNLPEGLILGPAQQQEEAKNKPGS